MTASSEELASSMSTRSLARSIASSTVFVATVPRGSSRSASKPPCSELTSFPIADSALSMFAVVGISIAFSTALMAAIRSSASSCERWDSSCTIAAVACGTVMPGIAEMRVIAFAIACPAASTSPGLAVAASASEMSTASTIACARSTGVGGVVSSLLETEPLSPPPPPPQPASVSAPAKRTGTRIVL